MQQVLWRLPDEQHDRQSIFQFRYGGPDGGATPKLIVRVVDEERFSVQGSEFGKRIFTLDVDREKALFSDHRSKTFCWLEREVDLTVLPLGSLPLRSLPLLLFDRLPLSATSDLTWTAEGVRFADRSGRTWNVHLTAEGSVDSWTVYQDDRPQVWLRHLDGDRLLSAPDLQLRWRLGRQEPLSVELGSLSPSERYRPDCEGIES